MFRQSNSLSAAAYNFEELCTYGGYRELHHSLFASLDCNLLFVEVAVGGERGNAETNWQSNSSHPLSAAHHTVLCSL